MVWAGDVRRSASGETSAERSRERRGHAHDDARRLWDRGLRRARQAGTGVGPVVMKFGAVIVAASAAAGQGGPPCWAGPRCAE